MIISIGTDIVEVDRFNHWKYYKPETLQRVYSQEELEYCLKNPIYTNQRLATRFAAKEAFYKALTQLYATPPCSFSQMLRYTAVTKSNSYPSLEVNWKALALSPVHVLLTLSHTSRIAIAYVMMHSFKE